MEFKFWMRRILALVIVAPTIYVLSVSLLKFGYEPAFTALVSLASVVVGFYFGARTANGGK